MEYSFLIVFLVFLILMAIFITYFLITFSLEENENEKPIYHPKYPYPFID